MAEQRNAYLGTPLRPWLRLNLVAADGTTLLVRALADTGNPCELIVNSSVLAQFNLGLAPGMGTNFGPLDGGWLRIQIPELDLDVTLLAYGSDAVVQAAQESHPDFRALAGLPLLRRFEYGGDENSFWIRTPLR